MLFLSYCATFGIHVTYVKFYPPCINCLLIYKMPYSSYRFDDANLFDSENPVFLHCSHITFEPGHEKMCLMSYANNKGADQPAHPHSLISAFVVRCLDSIISLGSIAKISRL